MTFTEDMIAGIEYGKLMATTPHIYNVTLTLANTEYNQALPAGTKKYTIQERGGATFRLAFETGKVATPTEPYMTVATSQTHWEDHIDLTGVTVYLADPTGGKIIEIIAWT